MNGSSNAQIKRRIFVLALTTTPIWGCVSQATNEVRSQESRESYIGWVRFVGEFALYDNQAAFERSEREHCISGALPLDKQRLAAKEMNGRRVKVTGVRVPWSLPDPLAISLNNDGSPITNWCGEEFVLFATDMIPE